MSNMSINSVHLTPPPLLTISEHEGAVNGIAYLPGEEHLVTCSLHSTIRIWNLENGEQEGMEMEHGGWAKGYAVTKDGKRILSGGLDKVLRVWDMEMHQLMAEWGVTTKGGLSLGDELGGLGGRTNQACDQDWFACDPLTGHTAFVNSISLSPDGTKLASASSDRTIHFWGTDSSDPIGGPLQHEESLQVITFSPSGEFVACSKHSGKVSIWWVPWWDDSKKAHELLLDLPAVPVPRHVPSDIGRQFDYLDLPTTHRSSLPHMCLRTIDATDNPSSGSGSAFSKRRQRMLPYLLCGQSHNQPRHAEVTTVHPGFAQPRVYVASTNSESTPESRTEPLPTAPGHYPGFSIIVESVSSTDLQNVDPPNPAPTDNLKGVQASCCALFSCCQGCSCTPSVSPAIELSKHTPQTSNPPVLPGITPLQSMVQNFLDLPAVAEPPSHTH
ncbi:WD40 repeat-like protein [Paxillus ammoniavirescens]|nr:WD40 repeat-like protein [Paxillus ammoniavirescens]